MKFNPAPSICVEICNVFFTFREVELNQKYDGIYAYLQYLYTGDLKASPETALGM